MCAELNYFQNKLEEPKRFFADVELYIGDLNQKKVALLYTGIGKTNAAFALTEALSVLAENELTVNQIINIGLAGGSLLELGAIVQVKRTTYSDFDLSIFNDPVPSFDLKVNKDLDLKQVVCYSADRFVTSPLDVKETSYVCDMELTSLARVADIKSIPLTAFKIVSDQVDAKASQINQYFNSKRVDTMAKLKNILLSCFGDN